MELNSKNVHDILTYDAETGIFLYKERGLEWFSSGRLQKGFNTRMAGRRAFVSSDTYGYKHAKIAGKHYLAHRVAFLMQLGFWPKVVDHINGNRSDNRWVNLRDVDHEINSRNKLLSKNNTSGCKGVSFHKGKGSWGSYIGVGGKLVNLGYFDSVERAAEARKEAETNLW